MGEGVTEYVSGAWGLGQFSNGDVAAVGGTRTGKPGTDGTARLRYVLYDAAAVAAGVPASSAAFGSCELNVVPADEDSGWRIEGIVALEVDRKSRGLGLGRRAVGALAGAALGGTLRVYDVKPSARGFWEACGFSLSRARGRLDGSADAADMPGRAVGSPSR